jgi:hypothetical protein
VGIGESLAGGIVCDPVGYLAPVAWIGELLPVMDGGG